ncbi:DEAD/DEAH box helicase family protein [Vibrio atlanticus]|uniref:Replication origin-binding protein domain-containing protein n=1 Tax=Vibrio atlanticus TaxID=693153 RepID=A0A1C3IL90_9VIBR|nr:DEAD/DEAH box helicase family protein [Vibrio atlanticus]SBS62170.1 hypothetical protein VAT7223_01013 [Vibrio atlanticus]
MKSCDVNTLAPFQHQIINNFQSNEICVLSHPNISIPDLLANKKVVAPKTVNHRNTTQICTYYKEAKQKLSTIVIDSKSYREHAINTVIDNYFSYQLPIFDVYTGRFFDCKDKLGHLLELAKLLMSDQILSIAVKQTIKIVPLSYPDANSLLIKYNLTGNFSEKFVDLFNQATSHKEQAVSSYYKIATEFKAENIDDIHSLNHKKLFTHTTTVALKAKTGVGKTKYVFSPLSQTSSCTQKVVYISHLVALSEQFCQQNQATSYSSSVLNEIENSTRLSLVINSLYKPHLLLKAMDADLLIIDEFEKVLSAIVGSKNNREMKSPQVYDALCLALKQAKQVIVGDADLSNFSLNFLKKIRPDLIFMNCTQNPYTSITAIVKAQEPILCSTTLKQTLFESKVFLFDTRSTLQATAVSLGFKNIAGLECEAEALKSGVLILHGKNKEMKAQKAFLSNPENEIQKYKAILASPCLSAGFSITTSYTNSVHIFCNGTLTPDELINFSRRFRSARQLIFCPRSVCRLHQDFSELERKDEFHALSLQYNEKKSYLNENIAFSLVQLLHADGFNVDVQECETGMLNSSRRAISNTTKTFRISQDSAIIEANDISTKKYQQLTACHNLTSLEIAECKRYNLKKTYQLNNISREDIKFDKVFNRKLFKVVCSIPDESNDLMSDDPNLLRAANLLVSIVFRSDTVDVREKSNHFIHEGKTLNIVACLAKHWKILGHEFPNVTAPYQINTKNKATRFLKSALHVIGADLTKFSGNTGKARIVFKDNALSYFNRL